MRTLLCAALVLTIASSATAQFAKSPALRGGNKTAAKETPKTEKPADPTADAATPPAAGATPQVNKLFAALDLDGDGVISKAEWHKAIISLKKLDTNGDGQLTMEECGVDPSGAPLALAGENNLTQANNFGPGQSGGPGGAVQNRPNNAVMARFLQYDRNHDGKLTPDELSPQAIKMLQGADTNGDGAIDAAEFQAAAARMGERMKAMGAYEAANAAGVYGRRP